MAESLKSERTIREYLLGRVSNESTLEQLEELLFSDEEFCSHVALVEDSLINEFVWSSLSREDAASFTATLATNADRAFKVELTRALREKALALNLKASLEKSGHRQDASAIPGFFAALSAFFHQPKYVGAFAVLLVAVLLGLIYFSTQRSGDELAELRSMYRESRPTESRLSKFNYAPLSQLRGTSTSVDQRRLRRIELSLIEQTEKQPGAESYYALGVVQLTQQKYADAINNFQTALKFDDKLARIHNDLGAAHFELAKTGPQDKKFAELSQSLEEFTKALELDANLLEALFNKGLVQQELRTPQQAKQTWLLYLQKDSSSQWAGEARKHLAAIESGQISRTDEQVLEDFLTAFRGHDEARAQGIHNETKGLLQASSIALQLSHRYLTVRRRGDEAAAKECLEALTWLGRYEREEHAEFFFLS